jgi:EAL domain-containing protein (putative c-di-GMP-specific phosphodiesterase class I)
VSPPRILIVEDEAIVRCQQLQAGIGCDAFQGYLFAKPVPSKALASSGIYTENRPLALMKQA